MIKQKVVIISAVRSASGDQYILGQNGVVEIRELYRNIGRGFYGSDLMIGCYVGFNETGERMFRISDGPGVSLHFKTIMVDVDENKASSVQSCLNCSDCDIIAAGSQIVANCTNIDTHENIRSQVRLCSEEDDLKNITCNNWKQKIVK